MRLPILLIVLSCGVASAGGRSRPLAKARYQVPASIRGVATDGTHVAVLTYDDELVMLSTRGALVFTKKLGKLDMFANVSLVDSTAIISSHAAVVALDADTGDERWHHDAVGNDMLTVQIEGDVVWMDGDAGSLTVQARSGTKVTRTTPAAAAEPAQPFDVKKHLRGNDYFDFALGGPDIYWLHVYDGVAREQGDMIAHWIAVSRRGARLDSITVPSRDVQYCGVSETWAYGSGVFVVGHAIRGPQCAIPVVDIFTKR